jgi:hypothetical protein
MTLGLAPPWLPDQAQLVDEGEKMKKIAIATAVAIGLGFLAVPAAPDANAAVRVLVSPYGYYTHRLRPWKPLNVPVYIACRKKVFAKYAFSPGALFMVDDCYTGAIPVF